MSRQASTPGFAGIVGIIAGVILVSVIITLVTGEVRHWLPVAGGIVVGLWAVQSINK